MRKMMSLLVVATMFATTFVSCKKDDGDSDNKVTASLIKTLSFDAEWAGGIQAYEFTYDINKKITGFNRTWDGDADGLFAYNFNTANKLIVTKDGSSYGEYTLNAQGYVTEDPDGNTYEYDANGFLVKMYEFWDDTHHLKYEVTIANGNISKITTYDDDGVTAKKIKEFFYTSGDNVNNLHQANAIDNDWKTIGNFYGKPSAKLVDHFDYWDPRANPIVKSTSALEYVFDAKNRPTTITKTLTDMTTEVWSYTYYE
jgi:hypothetical protein